MLYNIFVIVFIMWLLNPVQPKSSCPIEEVQVETINEGIPLSTRVYWMRAANKALSDLASPCPFFAFGTVIVNHTEPGLGKLVCMGINQISITGNPTAHGEIMAIGNCSTILTAKNGKYKLSVQEALSAFSQLSLYTNAETCSMCASAIRRAAFKEYIYGTSIDTLVKNGWTQIQISSRYIFDAPFNVSFKTKLIDRVLTNETDPYFKWQYNATYPCPGGCRRIAFGTSCTKC